MRNKRRKQQLLMLFIDVTLLALAGTIVTVQGQDVICCNGLYGADGNWIGAGQCKDLAEVSAPARAKVCNEIRKLGCCLDAAEVCGDPSLNCTTAPDPANGPKPKEKQPPDMKCEPPPPESNNPPWFNRDLPCSDRQRATMSWSQTRTSNMDVSFTVDMCGEVIRYIYPGGGRPERNPPGVRSFDVCCDSWRKATNTKSPCDARRDFDCDGIPNESDTMPDDAFRERRSDDFVSNSPLTGLPFWKKLHEPVQSGCKDCKWELVRVEYTCKNVADPVRAARSAGMVFDATYDYRATWKCASSGQTQETQDTVTMVDLRCPTPANRSWP